MVNEMCTVLQYITGVLNMDLFCVRERQQVKFLGGELACWNERIKTVAHLDRGGKDSGFV